MCNVSRTGWYVYGAVLFLAVFFTLIICIPVGLMSAEPARPAPIATPTAPPCADEDYPAYQPGLIYLAKQDEQGHYVLESTADLCVAEDEMRKGFYPVPPDFAEDYANQTWGK